MATVSELAEELQISKSLVYRYLRGDRTLRISGERAGQIEEAIKRLGGVRVRPKAGARIGPATQMVLAPINRHNARDWELFQEDHAEFTRNLERALGAEDIRFHISFFDLDERVQTIRQWLDEPRLCGGLLLESQLVDEALARLLRERNVPHVSTDPMAERFGVNTVTVHARAGLRQAIAHLREHGHHRIGWLGPQAARWPDFLAVMAEAGLPPDERFSCCWEALPAVHSDQVGGLAAERFSHWLDQGPAATAMICSNDCIALAAVRVMRGRALEPGKDLSLVGYDNMEERGREKTTHPILTTVDNPLGKVGLRCGHMLLNQMVHNQREIVHERLPTRLLVRQTTGPCGHESGSRRGAGALAPRGQPAASTVC